MSFILYFFLKNNNNNKLISLGRTSSTVLNRRGERGFLACSQPRGETVCGVSCILALVFCRSALSRHMLFFSSLLVKCVDGILKFISPDFIVRKQALLILCGVYTPSFRCVLVMAHRSLLFHVESFVVAHGLSSCGTQASVFAALGLSYLMTCGILVL